MKQRILSFTLIISTLIILSATNFAASPGALDSSFGIGGKVVTNIFNNEQISDIAVQENGKIVVVGTGSIGDFIVARYLANGTLDTTFSGDGLVFTDFDNNTDVPTAIKIQEDGKIIVAGTIQEPTGFNIAVARYNSNGSLDTTFGTSGKVNLTNGRIRGLDIQTDGKIVLGGQSLTDFTVVRLNSNGSLDTTFGSTGRVITLSGSGQNVRIQPDGKIVLMGESNTGSAFTVIRYNTNGTLDTTFSGDGIFTNDFPGGETWESLEIAEDGSILASGISGLNSSSSQTMNIVLLKSTGVLEPAFNGTGILSTSFIPNTFVWDTAIQSDGKILVGFESPGVTVNADSYVMRLNSNGSFDTSFGTNGLVKTNRNGGPGEHFALVGDKLLVAGMGNGLSGNWDFEIDRYNLSKTPTMTADFDGDGVTDTAVYRPSTGNWFVLRSSDNSFASFQFGLNGDVPIDGDFDGDGKSDLAIFRPSNGIWFFQKSSDGTNLGVTFGTSTDKPIPGDYDKDGKTDIAIFRPSTGEWLILRSSTNFSTFFGYPFGQNGDIPISSERK